MKVERTVMELSLPLHPILGITFMNFIFLIVLLIVFFSFFAVPSGFEIQIPSAVADNGVEQSNATIRVTGENVLYFNDRVVTINDLKRALIKANAANMVVYVRVDRRASMGRVADVWDLCKGLGAARVKVIASQSN